jgi:anti-sigma-K factor RskA
MNHPTWETLNDYADGSLTATARADTAKHVDGCEACRATVARIRSLVAKAEALPKEVEAPAEAWSVVQRRIEDGKVIDIGRREDRKTGRGASPRRYIITAVAALVLVVATSAITMFVTRGDRDGLSLVDIPGATDPNIRLASLPAEIASVERTYLESVSDLLTALDDPALQLSMETRRAVRRSLAVIDTAIAEARAALIADPASRELREMLTRNYEQKVDLLRRASARAGT